MALLKMNCGHGKGFLPRKQSGWVENNGNVLHSLEIGDFFLV